MIKSAIGRYTKDLIEQHKIQHKMIPKDIPVVDVSCPSDYNEDSDHYDEDNQELIQIGSLDGIKFDFI
jgi:hypothetical protein